MNMLGFRQGRNLSSSPTTISKERETTKTVSTNDMNVDDDVILVTLAPKKIVMTGELLRRKQEEETIKRYNLHITKTSTLL